MIQHKIDYSIALMQKAEKMALAYHPDGFHLAFSGGKDSIVLYELAKMAGVRFKAHMQLTSVDPPELLKFIRKYYPDVELHRPAMNIYDMIVKKMSLPTRKIRFCCSLLKETAGKGTVTLLGIRADESVNRSKRSEVEILGKKATSEIIDQWNNSQETSHVCIGGNDKIMLSPILKWTFSDVWRFIRQNNLPYCQLYDEGFTRIGCIFCPMASVKTKQRERRKYPGVERAYKRAIARLVSEHGTYSQLNHDVDDIFDWWISNLSIKEFLANRAHPKFDF